MKKETEKLPVDLKKWVAPTISTTLPAKYTLGATGSADDGGGTFKA
jgi:hypothetical protein